MASCDVVVSDILAYVAGCWQEFLPGKTLRLNSYHRVRILYLVACEIPL